jgi:hypothetical protein
MVDGQNILPERDRWLPDLQKLFNSLAAQSRAKIIRYLSEVNRKASDAITLAEAYQMEKSSRFRWAQYKGLDMMSSTCTGVEGTNRLGMNYCQLVWRALNYFEDLGDLAEKDWDNAKFIGSCFAGKEIKKIYNQDKERKRKEREARIERKDRVIRSVALGEDLNAPAARAGVRMIVARTTEELKSQLENDLNGERDWHDEVVARAEEEMHRVNRERAEQQRKLYEDRIAAQPHSFGGTDLTQSFTPQEARERIERKRQVEAQKNASRVIPDEKLAAFLSKYDTGMSDAPPDRNSSVVSSLVPPRPRGVPFRGK